MAGENTQITQISDEELSASLNMGGADNVISGTEKPKNSFLTQKTPEVDVKLNDKTPAAGADKPADDPVDNEDSGKGAVPAGDIKLNDSDDSGQTKPDDKEDKSGTNKTAFLDSLDELVKSNKILLFDDDKPLDKYTKKDLVELLEANIDRVKEEEGPNAVGQLFDALPTKLQHALKYVMDGGKDVDSFLLNLTKVSQIEKLDASTESGQEQIVRQYLSFRGDHSAEEIEAEIASLKDISGALEKKASSYKPKLEAAQKQIIDKEIKEQEEFKNRQQQAVVKYREDIQKTLRPGELNGIKLDSATQGLLYAGLTQASYPSIQGKNTNLLGHLLEKYQWVEPNHSLIAEALWLLNDPKAYKDAIRKAENAETTKKTFKDLKTAGNEKTSAATTEQGHQQGPKKLQRKQNIFTS